MYLYSIVVLFPRPRHPWRNIMIQKSIWSVLLIGQRAACYRVRLLHGKVFSRLSDAVMKVRDKLLFATRHWPKLEKDAIPCIVIHKNNLQYHLGKWKLLLYLGMGYLRWHPCQHLPVLRSILSNSHKEECCWCCKSAGGGFNIWTVHSTTMPSQ